MDFIDKEDGALFFLKLTKHCFQTFFEVTSILGTGNQCAQIKRVDSTFKQHVRHIALDDLECNTLCNRGLAYTGFTNQQRIVFSSPAQYLRRALDFFLTANQGIYLAFFCLEVQIG